MAKVLQSTNTDKPIFIATNEAKFHELYDTYIDVYTKYWDIPEKNRMLSQGLVRKFDVRLRLVLGLSIQFNTKYAQTKTPNVAQLYQLKLKLNEIWFAYEALLAVCEEGRHTQVIQMGRHQKLCNTNPFTLNKLAVLGLENEMQAFNTYLAAHLLHDERYKNDTIDYLQYLYDNSSRGLKPPLKRCIRKIDQQKDLDFVNILSFTYAIRNLYVHNGDAAKTGVKYYTTKVKLLQNVSDFMVLICLKIVNQIIVSET